jgi:hypothetical protein
VADARVSETEDMVGEREEVDCREENGEGCCGKGGLSPAASCAVS